MGVTSKYNFREKNEMCRDSFHVLNIYFTICLKLNFKKLFYVMTQAKPTLPSFESNKLMRTLKEITGVLSSHISVLKCSKNEQQSLVFGI